MESENEWAGLWLRLGLKTIGDVYDAATGANCRPDPCAPVEVTDALIDTGASGLLAPRAIIDQLGLLPLRKQSCSDDRRYVLK